MSGEYTHLPGHHHHLQWQKLLWQERRVEQSKNILNQQRWRKEQVPTQAIPTELSQHSKRRRYTWTFVWRQATHNLSSLNDTMHKVDGVFKKKEWTEMSYLHGVTLSDDVNYSVIIQVSKDMTNLNKLHCVSNQHTIFHAVQFRTDIVSDNLPNAAKLSMMKRMRMTISTTAGMAWRICLAALDHYCQHRQADNSNVTK